MNRAFVGGRTYRALHLVREAVLAAPRGSCIVSGHARGVDIVAEITALQRGMDLREGITTRIFPARGRTTTEFTRAAFARNFTIAQTADEVDAFINEESRGTWDTINKARMLGKVLRVHEEPGSPAEHALLFHTAVHPNSRQAKGYRGPSLLDITRGSGGPEGLAFAPSQKLLTEARRRCLADAPEFAHVADWDGASEMGSPAFDWYRGEYTAEMRTSWRTQRPAWDALLARSHLIASCYCSARKHCHRGIFAELLVKAGEKVGRRVVDGGEVPCR